MMAARWPRSDPAADRFPGFSYHAGMSTPATTDRPKPPAPECAPSQVGLCAKCQHPCHRYGHGGNPLCVLCRKELEEWRAGK